MHPVSASLLPLLLFLLFTLSLASVTQARDFVRFDERYANTYNFGQANQISAFVQTETSCIDLFNARAGAVAWAFVTDGRCFTYAEYPTICSGYGICYGWSEGIVDRSQGDGRNQGHVVAPDGTCVYTGGVAFSDAAYVHSCKSDHPVNPSAVPQPFKRASKVQSAFKGGMIYPIEEMACPVKNGLECFNAKANLNSCGGCIGGAGVDCSDLPGADEVACVRGRCVADSCIRGYSLSTRSQCVRK